MTCTACGHENRPGRKFCGECGAALALACAGCGTPYEAGEKFCGECGAALGPATPRRTVPGTPAVEPGPGVAGGGRPNGDAGARKVVTIVFADLVGSTALHERVDAESARRLMERYYLALRRAVEAHGGTVVKLLGDGVMAAFGLRRVAEDDALRALRAAVAMQDAFRALVRAEGAALATVGLRVAVNTGEVVVAGDADDVIGDPVNVAARLQEQGGDGDVVLGETTHRLVATRVTLAPLGSITLKGRAEAVAAHRLVSLEPPAGAAAAPFVGRDAELARLEGVLDAAVTTPATRLAVLVGSPGLGKSRLIDELARRHADDASILAAHCDAAGGATFAPLADALRRFLGLADGAAGDAVGTAVSAVLGGAGDDPERARIAAGIDKLLGGSAMSPEETFFVVRRFLAALAASQPVVLVIDDLHWGEPLLFDLVEHLVQWGSGVPVFVLVGARPELRELRSSLVQTGGVVADVVVLGGLDAGAAMRLAAGVIGAADLPAAVAAKVLATSEGNPLFVGELVRMLVQEGALAKEGDRWTVGANLAALEMPPTIHALLAARIERLRAEDRTVLERAAVVGRHFSRSAVAALLGANGGSTARDASDLDGRLESLRRSELIERDTGWLLGEPVLRFHHVLIRDAAYRRLLKGTRAELHARLADWIEGQVGDAPEHDEMVGRHLEQAHQLLSELGALDAAGAVLGERAARRLAAAGRRALARDDVSLAAGLLGRATQRLAADAAERADLVLDWCEALLAAGDVGPAADAIAELDRLAGDTDRGPSDASGRVPGRASDHGGGDASGRSASAAPNGTAASARLRAWHTCFAGQLTVLTAPEALHEATDRVGAAARTLAALDDAAGEAKAHFVHAQALARLGKIGACEAALDLALAAARRAGDRRRANAVLAGAPLAALWGPSPVTRASGRCLDVVRVLRITQGAPAVEAVALSCQGVLEALRGRTEAARRMLESSRTMVEELGISHRLFETEVFAGRIDLLEGDAAVAERALRAGYDGLRGLGLGIDAARAAALLGRALLAQDRAAEAETLSHESELLAGDDLQAAIAWRGVRAEALARRGDHATALALAEAAVAIAAATDALLDHADARLALAAALRAAGRGRDAEVEERRAIELWEAKGATVLVERTRRANGPVATGGAAAQPRRAIAVRRRIAQNRASRALVAFNAAMAARDFAAFRAQLSENYEEIDHPNGVSYGRDANVAALERLMRSRDATCHMELLAALGDALVLCRRTVHANATGGGRFDVGEYAQEAYGVAEVGADGRWSRHEVFGADHLGSTIVRLYQRYAELLPDGPERARAAVTAESYASIMRPNADLARVSAALAPDFEGVDHRLLSSWSMRGAEALLAHTRALRAVANDVEFRHLDVVALDRAALLTRVLHTGTDRAGGGIYERPFLRLFVTGSDGRITRAEWFDDDRDAEALACFDGVTGGPPHEEPGPAPPRARPMRAPRANAVTRVSAEFEALVAARDFAALDTFFAADAECVDHPTGASYGAGAMATGMRRLMRSPDASLRFVLLATLGDSWGLVRREMSASGLVGRHFDMGPYEIVDVAVYGTDERGRLRDVEIFAPERLGAAIVRLYERYAERLPDGSTRAGRIARSVAVLDGPITFDEIAAATAEGVEVVDQRTLGTWSARGREEWLTHWRAQIGLADDSSGRYDEILALEPGAILAHQTFFGSSRTTGGTFEVVTLVLHVFDADGLIARTELFEPERGATALARFDALTADTVPRRPVRRRVRPNAATRTIAAIEAAFARRDLAAVDARLGDPLETIEHPTATRYGRAGQLESSRRMMRMPDLEFRLEPLATLGDSLCLARRVVTASGTAGGTFDVGAYEIENLVVNAVDATGRLTSAEVFASDHLCQALARLYALCADSLPDGPERTRAAGIAASHSVWDGPIDADRIGSVFAASYVAVDHRSLGTWSSQGREESQRHWQGQAELAAGFSRRDEDILAFSPAVNVTRHTYFGTSRATGGPFENVFLAVNVFDADGRYTLVELFEPDQEAAALARFDELLAAEASGTTVRRRVRANAATRGLARFAAVIDARDRDAVGDVFDESLHFTHHPTGATYGRREMVATWRSILKAERVTFRSEILASLGETLALERHQLAIEGLSESHVAGFGLAEFDEIVVIETDARGRWIRTDLFDADRFGDAIARLYARHAELLPDGPLRERAAMIARVTTTMLTRSTEYRLEDVSAADFQAVDHRTVGIGTATGSGFWQRWRAATDELTQDQTYRIEDVLALGADGLLRRTTEMGTVRASGGAFENSVWILSIFGPDGRQSRIELFEVGREAEALARYDALVGAPAEPATPAPSTDFFANAATQALYGVARTTEARDWARLADLMATSLRFDDRRPLFQMQLGKEGFLEQHRVLFDVPNARWVMTPIATRGERLTLSRILLQGEVADGGGALEIDHLGVIEVDDDGRMTAIVLFEPADLDAAYAELETRFDAGEGAELKLSFGSFVRKIANRDWEALIAGCAPTLVEYDHRPIVNLGTTYGPEAWVQKNVRSYVDLAPDSLPRFFHVRAGARGSMWHCAWEGTREGGRYEIPMVGVSERDDLGRTTRVDVYDPEQLDQARARFAELTAPAPVAEPFANAASATVAPVIAAIVAHDWQRFRQLFADDFRMSDRRRVVQLELDREQYVAFTREVADGRTVRAASELLATRGERLALTRPVYEFSDADVGPSEIAFLILTEVDARGRIVANVRWDVEELDAAYAELDARGLAGGAAAHPRVAAYQRGFARGLAERDWKALAALHAPSLVARDHRLVGWGELSGPDAYVGAMRAMVELAPDAQGRLDHVRTAAHGLLAEVVWVGTRDGGAFESPFLWVVELDAEGRAQRLDFYDPRHVDAARARFAEIDGNALQATVDRQASQTTLDGTASQATLGGTPARPARRYDPFAALVKPTLVTAAMDGWLAAYDAGFATSRWEAMRPLLAPGYVFDDRRRLALLHGDVELMLASLRERAASGARAEWTVVGAAGERIAIGRMLWSGGPPDGRFEIEYLAVVEVDAAGLIVANVLYDLDDSRAALRDAWARWAAIEPDVTPAVTLVTTAVDAFAARDRERLRPIFTDDVVVEDHRQSGIGRIEGADPYVEAVAVLWELASDHQLELGWFWPAVERHGFVATLNRFGTLPDGGPFDSPGLWLCVVTGDRIARAELFEVDDVDRAVARLAELRPDPLRIPPNAATRAIDQRTSAFEARAWDALRDLCADSLVFEDRRWIARTVGDRAMFLESNRLVGDIGAHVVRTVLATAGDRLALECTCIAAGGVGAEIEVETLVVSEIDADGRLVAIVFFDPTDRIAASAELFERYAASGADGAAPVALDVMRAWNAHDLARLRALLPADFYLDDRRRTGVGRLDGADAYLASLAALWELSRDLRLETLYFVAIAPHGRLYVSRWFGTNAEGGELDAVYACVAVADRDRPLGLELFELDDLDAACARFDELRTSLP